MTYEIATLTCPQCHRHIRVLADEYGDHGCACGWGPENERKYDEGDDAE